MQTQQSTVASGKKLQAVCSKLNVIQLAILTLSLHEKPRENGLYVSAANRIV
jgi:hypothetical protein